MLHSFLIKVKRQFNGIQPAISKSVAGAIGHPQLKIFYLNLRPDVNKMVKYEVFNQSPTIIWQQPPGEKMHLWELCNSGRRSGNPSGGQDQGRPFEKADMCPSHRLAMGIPGHRPKTALFTCSPDCSHCYFFFPQHILPFQFLCMFNNSWLKTGNFR